MPLHLFLLYCSLTFIMFLRTRCQIAERQSIALFNLSAFPTGWLLSSVRAFFALTESLQIMQQFAGQLLQIMQQLQCGSWMMPVRFRCAGGEVRGWPWSREWMPSGISDTRNTYIAVTKKRPPIHSIAVSLLDASGAMQSFCFRVGNFLHVYDWFCSL